MSKLLPAFVLLLSAAMAEAQLLDFNQGWELKGDGVTTAPYMGKEALRLGTGFAPACRSEGRKNCAANGLPQTIDQGGRTIIARVALI